jgi:hypothetical protein
MAGGENTKRKGWEEGEAVSNHYGWSNISKLMPN